jgi:hypothetical protein
LGAIPDRACSCHRCTSELHHARRARLISFSRALTACNGFKAAASAGNTGFLSRTALYPSIAPACKTHWLNSLMIFSLHVGRVSALRTRRMPASIWLAPSKASPKYCSAVAPRCWPMRSITPKSCQNRLDIARAVGC